MITLLLSLSAELYVFEMPPLLLALVLYLGYRRLVASAAV
jgi:hypothetical protein